MGHGNPFVDEVLQPLNCTGLVCVPFGPKAAMHHAITDDIDKDGKLDLITFKAGTSIFSNFKPGKWGHHPGNGKPQNLGVWSGNTGAFTGTFMDLDGDGYPEMITAGQARPTAHQLSGGGVVPHGGITVWKNHGGRNFTVMQKLPGGPGSMYGRLMLKNGNDLILYGECGDDCAQNSYIKVYSTGGGQLRLKQVFNVGAVVGTYSKGHPPRLLDINGDGHKDLFVNHYNNYAGSVGTQHGGIWLNNGNGTFSRLKTPIFARIAKAHLKGMLAPVHANGDGRLDWIVIYQDGTFGTLLASGGGLTSSPISDREERERAIRFLPIVNWQLGFVGVEINQLADALTNNRGLLSFNQIQMTDLLGFNSGSAITLGFRAGDNESIHDPAYGFRYGDTHLAFMTESSLLGLHPAGLLHVERPKTRYVGIRHKKTLGNWTTDGQITYGHAKGKGSYGYVRGVRDIHAMGFNVATRYRLKPDQKVLFSVSQPMRIERGGLIFDRVIGDLVPTGRQTDLTLGFTHELNQTSTIKAAFTYTTDSNHYPGQRNSQIMLTYMGGF